MAIDGSTPVPALAHAAAFVPDAEAAIGHKATTVPGTVAFGLSQSSLRPNAVA